MILCQCNRILNRMMVVDGTHYTECVKCRLEYRLKIQAMPQWVKK